tara:strand:+ start:758 stop:1045 length:288 start_codon:yes stop_codon:yes gene_type:complete
MIDEPYEPIHDPVFAREPQFTDTQRWSPYAYGRGNPLRYSDPTGEFTQIVGAVIIGGAVGAFANTAGHMLTSRDCHSTRCKKKRWEVRLREHLEH